MRRLSLGLAAALLLAGCLTGCCEGRTDDSEDQRRQLVEERLRTEAAARERAAEHQAAEDRPVEDPEPPAEDRPDPQVEARVRQAASLRRSEPERARGLYRQACEEGEHQGACIMLANMLERGEGGEADAEEARSLFQQACFAGNTGACDRMGH